MIYNLIYFLIQRLSNKKRVAAINVDGTLKNSKIEHNVTFGGPLLNTKKISGGSVSGNLTYLPAPRNTPLIWKVLLDITVLLIASFLTYKFGWNK